MQKIQENKKIEKKIKVRYITTEKIQQKKKEREEQNNLDDMQRAPKRPCLNIEHRHSYLSSSHGMVSFTPGYIQHLKETYNERSYLGLLEYNCKYYNAMF